MNPAHIVKISKELNLREKQVVSTAVLLDEGSTVPFIARYRKEATQNMDEVALQKLYDLIDLHSDLEKRRVFILREIESQGKLALQRLVHRMAQGQGKHL